MVSVYTEPHTDILLYQAVILNEQGLLTHVPSESMHILAALQEADEMLAPKSKNAEKDAKDFLVSPSALVDIRKYKPEVDENGTWWVSEIDCEFLATGCSILA